jgi:hypothetical protein
MTDQTPTHWTQFDQLYDLPDPRPYFRGVATGDYRMPGVLAGVLERLLPLIAARAGRPPGPARLIDFACGYGAVGLCLRAGATMAGLTERFQDDDGPEADAAHFRDRIRTDVPPHVISGVDIAATALDYARRVGAVDAVHSDNILEGGPGSDLAADLGAADMIFECGAIGDHLTAALDVLLKHATGTPRPWLILSPRPRIDVAGVSACLADHGYDTHVLLPRIGYRKAFSDMELAEEIASGTGHGLSEEECLVGDYFRVDMRLAVPTGENIAAARAAVAGFDPASV